ncbi:MAG: CvpA family protein [Dehalococcoidia bacterium]
MSWVDGLIIVTVVWFTFSAFQAGLVRETVTVVAAVAGVVLAGMFYRDLADDILAFVDNERVSRIIAFGLIFAAAALAGQLAALFLKPTVALLQLGLFDHFGGAAFGFVKAMVFIEVFLLVFVTYPQWGVRKAIDESYLGSFIVVQGAVLERILPKEFNLGVDQFSRKDGEPAPALDGG